MNLPAILGVTGCTLVGAGAGFLVGAWLGDREGGDDFGFGMALYALAGATWGAMLGAVAGAAIFA